MAAASSQNTALAFVPLIVGLAVAAIALLLMFSIGSGGGLASPSGASTPLKVNPAPESPLKDILGDYSRFTDPSSYLKLNSKDLDDLSTKLRTMDSTLVDNTQYKTISPANVSKIKVILKEMMQDVTTMQTAIAASNGTITESTTTNARVQLAGDWGKLDLLALGGSPALLIKTSSAMVAYNKDGKGTIVHPPIPPDGQKSLNYTGDGGNGLPAYLDCSAFLSLALQQAGVFKAGETTTVTGFAGTAPNDSRFTVVDSTTKGVLNNVVAELQPGDIILSSNGTVSTGYSPDNQNHAVIYLGAGTIDPTTHVFTADPAATTTYVADSTSLSDGRTGPLYETLQSRITRNTIQMIVRIKSL